MTVARRWKRRSALTAAFAGWRKVVIEECLSGFEFSLICLVCATVVPLEIARITSGL
ncbi:MAG: hypothetical protein ACLVJ6_13230 [Merdibacter sp.]